MRQREPIGRRPHPFGHDLRRERHPGKKHHGEIEDLPHHLGDARRRRKTSHDIAYCRKRECTEQKAPQHVNPIPAKAQIKHQLRRNHEDDQPDEGDKHVRGNIGNQVHQRRHGGRFVAAQNLLFAGRGGGDGDRHQGHRADDNGG